MTTASSTSGPQFRNQLAGIPGYRAGKRPAPRTDGIEAFKVSSNENPYPPLPRVIDVIAEAATQVNRYPDPASTELIEAIVAHFDVPAEHVAVATGAVALCYQLAHAAAGPGDEVLFAWRSFEAYPIVAAVSGATAVQVPLRADGTHDLPAMAAAVTERTRLIFVCSPNNPTGTIVTQDEFDAFMQQVPPSVVVALDEAYIEFNRDPSAVEGLRTYQRYQNLVVLRTFSKAYGLAGLRVGYAIGSAAIIEALNKTALPFGVSIVAQAAAVASLADADELHDRVAALITERDRVYQHLIEAGLELPESQANFIWLPLGAEGAEFAAVAEEAGLTVRSFPGDGVRATIAETPANDRLVDLVRRYTAG